MTRLIVLRHGFSLSNAERRYTGQSDIPLSPLGLEQAERVADLLCATEKIDAIYASDLSRAMQTLAPTAARLGLTVIPEAGLRETDVGLWTGRVYEEVCETDKDYMARHRADPDVPCPGGESTRQVYERVIAAVTRILADHEGETVALATHAMPARCIAAFAAGHGAEQIGQHRVAPNAAIRIYEWADGRLRATGDNIVSHLETPGKRLPRELL